ncbi:MAG: hypothetical protein JRD89_02845 [Deltaproteobacteria bacterium]|nr:hypothetical protein [Deltaproteobacteria bacterium]
MPEIVHSQPAYIPDKNPHNWLSRIADDRWACQYCGLEGTIEDIDAMACTHEYPPCKYCGLTPICAVDCPGVWQALMSPEVYLAGQEVPE